MHLTFAPRGHPIIIAQAAAIGTITGAGFRTAWSFTLPGGSLGANRILAVQLFARRTTGTGATTWRLQYGSTQTTSTWSAGGVYGIALGWLHGAGATNAQRGWIAWMLPNAAPGTAAMAEDSTTDLTISVLADLTTDTDVWTIDYGIATLW